MQVTVTGFLLGQTDRRQRRDREYDTRNAVIIGSVFRRSHEQVLRNDFAIDLRYRCQHWTDPRGIAGSVDRRVRYALQVRGQAEPMSIAFDAGGIEVEIVNVRNAAGAVHDQARLHRLVHAAPVRVYPDTTSNRLDPVHAAIETDIDPDPPRLVENTFDQIAIELRQWPIIFVKDCHHCAGACGDVRLFERNIAAADKRDRVC